MAVSGHHHACPKMARSGEAGFWCLAYLLLANWPQKLIEEREAGKDNDNEGEY
jgi:hypothetical protein